MICFEADLKRNYNSAQRRGDAEVIRGNVDMLLT